MKKKIKNKPLKFVAFWSEKGGVGKTTLCFNVAFGLYLAGFRVMVLDIDPQGSIVFAASLNEKGVPFAVAKGPLKQRPTKAEFDIVLIDHPSRLIPPMDEVSLIVMPLQASALDLHAFQRSHRALPGGVPTLPVLNGVDIRREEDRQFVAQMDTLGAVVVRNRSIFKRQMGQGQSVYTAGFRFAGNEAKSDIEEIVTQIKDLYL